MGKTDNVYNETLDPNSPAIPCGLIAKSMFNDTFHLFNKATNKEVEITSSGIAWPSDLDGRYKNIDKKR